MCRARPADRHAGAPADGGAVSLSYPGNRVKSSRLTADGPTDPSSPALSAPDSACFTLKHPTMRATFLILSLCLLGASLNEKVRRHFPLRSAAQTARPRLAERILRGCGNARVICEARRRWAVDRSPRPDLGSSDGRPASGAWRFGPLDQGEEFCPQGASA